MSTIAQPILLHLPFFGSTSSVLPPHLLQVRQQQQTQPIRGISTTNSTPTTTQVAKPAYPFNIVYKSNINVTYKIESCREIA